MGTNFTVIQFQRQHFGHQPGSFDDIEPDVPFVGQAREFVFDCPCVNADDTAVLLFQSRDVSHRLNILRINGIQLYGGLPVSPSTGHLERQCPARRATPRPATDGERPPRRIA